MSDLKFRKRAMYCILLLFLVSVAVFVVRFFINGEKWTFYETNQHIYKDGKITEIGTITDREGVVLSQTVDGTRVYNKNANIRKATIHVVGDSDGFIGTGVQNALRDRLVGYSFINGVYTFSGKGNNARLTIDADISAAALKALGNTSGCVGIVNYKTGEVLCMVSTPTFDIADKKEFEKAKNGQLGSVFINRFISSAYTPGSTFKIVTAAAALDAMGEGVYNTSFLCDYGTVIGGETLSCMGKHRSVTLKRAFSHSCNAYFSNLAISVGKKQMTKYAEKMGFNKTFYIDTIAAAKTSYTVKDARDIDFGWSGIGQYKNLMNPLQYLCMVSAIANGGEYIEPYIVKNITTQSGYTTYSSNIKKVRMIDKNIADSLYSLMDYAVENNYGKANFGTLDVCGKTGTAEVGEGRENSLFIGFCKDENLPLAFVVVAEGDEKGNKNALSISNRTLQAAKNKLLSR